MLPTLRCGSTYQKIVIVVLLAFLVLFGSSFWLPMVWDEGNAIRRSDKILDWFDQGMPLSTAAMDRGWPYVTQVEGHPSFYGLVIAAGRAASSRFLEPLDAARLGPICLFAVAIGAVFWRVRRSGDHGLIAATGAAGAILLLPRLFAHAHFASFDGPLTACWLLAWALFDTGGHKEPATSDEKESACSVWQRHLLKNLPFGIAMGMTLSCKATGWLAPIPFILWAVLYRDRKALVSLAVGLPVAILTFYALNPPLWLNPIDGFLTFLQMNFHRDEMGLNLSTQFLGRLYDLNYSLPWYNTFFWVGVTVPVPLLILLVVELVAIVRHPFRARVEMLVALSAAILLIVRMLPGVPVHDGVRLFLPAFAFLAILIGFGAARVWNWRRFRRVGPVGVVVCYLAASFNLFWFAPHWLSYYNVLIGGPTGAATVGMEPTYYWDSLDDETLDWLNQNTGPGEKVRFVSGPTENLILLRQWEKLKPPFATKAPGRYRWHVIQNRPGALSPDERRQLQEATPIYQKTLGSGGVGPWRRDVLLLGIYSERGQKTEDRGQEELPLQGSSTPVR
ncbi:MAG: hypothetical protein PVH19_00935 [Planctomycetia bacterium]|jgi:4-amino-4-deoxy-L-arabinose transferase-like glycosyltransferase